MVVSTAPDPVSGLVDLTRGFIHNHVFTDPEVYRIELERVFARSWLFVGHETMLPKPGDYITNFMGEDAVIVVRDQAGQVRVLLNKCRHRGNKVCLFDRGNTRTFTCSYHGWSYALDGSLSGVPFFEEVYYGRLDKASNGLVEAKVAIYGGLIFACWEPQESLDEFLGDARWYLDRFLTVPYLGGLEVVPGRERYIMPVNWKLLAENFGSDEYHFPVTHASVLKLLAGGNASDRRIASAPSVQQQAEAEKDQALGAVIGYGHGAVHAMGELKVGTASYHQDLAQAERLGPEAVDWVKERHRRLGEMLEDCAGQPYSYHNANLFPNFSTIGTGSALYGRGLILWHPKGPFKSEVWQWCAIEKDAPMLVKKHAAFVLMERQSGAGLVAPDDHENFSRIGENLKTPIAQRYAFNYSMAIDFEGGYPGAAEWQAGGLPGYITPEISEVAQRQFYRHWCELMRAA
ncbi:MAG TPA: SRPBCC family protein [Chloroflexota bacterium]|nr:SRPBCC family protein [Chloroflexota bacterium]